MAVAVICDSGKINVFCLLDEMLHRSLPMLLLLARRHGADKIRYQGGRQRAV